MTINSVAFVFVAEQEDMYHISRAARHLSVVIIWNRSLTLQEQEIKITMTFYSRIVRMKQVPLTTS